MQGLLIAGINDGHNGAVALLRDGQIEFAWQEERFTRTKNQPGFPHNALTVGLKHIGASLADVDIFAVASNDPVRLPASVEEELQGYAQRSALRGSLRKLLVQTPMGAAVYRRRQAARMEALLKKGLPREKLRFYDHHACHAATAFYGSGRSDRHVLIITSDGAGDGLSGTVYVGQHGKLERQASIPEADSLGLVYTTSTVLLGMLPNDHEYKVMGLAPYGVGPHAQALAEHLLAWIDPPRTGELVYRRRRGAPSFFRCYEALRALYERGRFDHIAAAVQTFLETVLVRWVEHCVRETGIHDVLLSGGVFMNVKANQKIMNSPLVEDLYIVPSCGDETNAFGAAYLAQIENGGATPEPIGPFYYGPSVGAAQAIETAAAALGSGRYRVHRPAQMAAEIARLLFDGQIVARVAGREEFGARALGNRSLLADPSQPGVVREINAAIKRREFWMPFACSVLEERAADYIVNPKGVAAPYMMLAFDSTARWHEIQAGLHPHDRTVRPQLVQRGFNPDYHNVLKAFASITGRGALLNTSFNLHGEPLVSSARDAVDLLRRSELKWLVLEHLLIEKLERTA